jgi:tellurite resistance protein
MNEQFRLKHFPVSFFATTMGLSGLTIAWEKAEQVLQLPFNISLMLMLLVGGLYLVLAAIYLVKMATHRQAVIGELHHPVKLNFFPASSISLILLSIVTLGHYPLLSLVLWGIGSAAHLLFTFYVMGAWINHQHFEIQHMNPAWFIPVVGNILVPIVGVSHGFVEVSWFFFSIGLVFWMVLLTIIFYRVIFHNPLPAKLVPTFFILIAPPAVGFISYFKLVGEIDAFAHILYYAGLFFTLLLFTQFRKFTGLKFFLSWWAYSFPMAAITVATFVMYKNLGSVWFKGGAVLLLVVLTLIIAMLVFRTLRAIAKREICVEE